MSAGLCGMRWVVVVLVMCGVERVRLLVWVRIGVGTVVMGVGRVMVLLMVVGLCVLMVVLVKWLQVVGPGAGGLLLRLMVMSRLRRRLLLLMARRLICTTRSLWVMCVFCRVNCVGWSLTRWTFGRGWLMGSFVRSCWRVV